MAKFWIGFGIILIGIALVGVVAVMARYFGEIRAAREQLAPGQPGDRDGLRTDRVRPEPCECRMYMIWSRSQVLLHSHRLFDSEEDIMTWQIPQTW